MIVRNIWGVGRNYPDHARELGNSTPTHQPLIFLKAGSCASINSNEIVIPHWANEVHHEVELAIKLNAQLQPIEGAVALDLTERQQQSIAKKEGLPWTLAKSFEGACAVSAFFSLRDAQPIGDRRIRLWVNDELRQDGFLSQMVFSTEKILEYLLEHFPLCPGDLILTGTPAGVGPISDGDRIVAEISDTIRHQWTVRKQLPPLSKQEPKE